MDRHHGKFGKTINRDFWKGKRVLVTGHTGFKGSWLCLWLIDMGAKVAGYALNPHTDRDNFVVSGLQSKMIDVRGDLKERDKLNQLFEDFQPEIVFHLAAQPLVRESYEKPADTYETNVMGTLYVLECIRFCKSVKTAILITTDKCYKNKEQIWGYRETDAFGGYDPYSSSKACAEILIDSYRNSYFNLERIKEHGKAIASVRAGNVIGGGDWAKDRLIPDCMRAMEQGVPIEVRSPKAVRPWQHVLDALSGYLLLTERLWESPCEYGGGWNFGPEYDSFETVWNIVERVISEMKQGEVIDCSSQQHSHEANLLFLDITKAKSQLGWKPKWKLDQAICKTMQWYKKEMQGEDMYKWGLWQIEEFMGAD